jgi:uncharacterized protein YxjI
VKKYIVKQRIIAFGEDFDIRDEHGNKLYFVDGMAFSFGHNLAVRDMKRNEIARIKQKLMTFAPTYRIMRRGQQIAIVKKRLFTIRNTFLIDVPGPNDYKVVGNLLLHNYKIYRGKIEVARVSKKIIAVRDSYGIEINENEDHILLLCSAIIIDMVLHNKKKK